MGVNFKILEGKIIKKITGAVGDEVMDFVTDKGRYELYHEQSCCERVYIEDVVGDLNDLLNSPVLLAEEVIQDRGLLGIEDSQTWTFYKLSTINGSVTIRWVGRSNGYYSEAVDFAKVE